MKERRESKGEVGLAQRRIVMPNVRLAPRCLRAQVGHLIVGKAVRAAVKVPLVHFQFLA